jgi:hypothetical protein
MTQILVRDKPRILEKCRKGFTFKRNADTERDLFPSWQYTVVARRSSPHPVHARWSRGTVIPSHEKASVCANLSSFYTWTEIFRCYFKARRMSGIKKMCLIGLSVPAVPVWNRRLEEYLDHLNILNEAIYGELLKLTLVTYTVSSGN